MWNNKIRNGYGSFIKPEKVILERCAFDALKCRYSKEENIYEPLYVENKNGILRPYIKVEGVGFDENAEKYM